MQKLNLMMLVTSLSLVACVDAAPRNNTPRDTAPGIPEYQKRINNWTGHPVSHMIEEWGPPDQTLRIAGKEYIVYKITTTETYVTPGSSGYYNYGRSSPSSSHEVHRLRCTYTFEIKRGIIVGGNAVHGTSPGCKR